MNRFPLLLAPLLLRFAAPAYAADAPKGPAAASELPLGAIRPTGWLKGQLEIQARGLSGHLDEFWPDIKDSSWIGGKAEGWERAPYWLDGIIPLAYLLDDARLKAKAQKYVDYILEHQQPDGWLGPIGDNDPGHKPYDVWPLFVIFKALTQYQEATSDPRVIPALLKCSKKIDEVISKEPLYSWAHFRGADLVVPLLWLRDKTGDASLRALSEKVLKQSYDWRHHFENFDNYRTKRTTGLGLDNHGVNNGMGLKFPAMRYRITGDIKDRAAIFPMLETLDRYHGQATGAFSCDEHYAGRSPSQGTELCTVAEMMYSLEVAGAILDDTKLGDRLEKLAFNAFPATFKKDMTAHQYDQQANQVQCKVSEQRVYTDNGPDANLYGLEPNFGCCTANMHQGWPKFVAHLWARSNDGGLAALAYAPNVLETTINGKKVRVETITDYPFSDTIQMIVTTAEPTTFPIRLRVPGWAEGHTIEAKAEGTDLRMTAAGVASKGKATSDAMSIDTADKNSIVVANRWTGKGTITLRLPMKGAIQKGYNDSTIVERGPLVYSLKIGTEWKKHRGTEPFADYEVFPTTPWNYALAIDRDHPENSLSFETQTPGENPFSQDGAPIMAHVKGRRVASWVLEKNAAAPPPRSPVASNEPLEDLILIPYGCTDLRVTEFPTVKP